MMEFVNVLYERLGSQSASSGQLAACGLQPAAIREAFETLVLLLAPFAPHVAEELWERLGHREGLARAPWPAVDLAALEAREWLFVVHVNGKVRARVTVPAGTSDEALRKIVLADAQVKRFVDGQTIKQLVIVPKRLVNVVV